MRWIYSFQYRQDRELSTEEVAGFREIAQGRKRAASGYGLLSVLCLIVGITGILQASRFAQWGWTLAIIALAAFAKCLTMATQAEEASLLARRIARISKVQRYDRATAPYDVRRQYETREDEEESVYWAEDERLMEMLVKELGKEPEWIEVLYDDNVLATVEGKPIRKVSAYWAAVEQAA